MSSLAKAALLGGFLFASTALASLPQENNYTPRCACEAPIKPACAPGFTKPIRW